MTAVVISPDGTWLATSQEDGTVRTWDAATGQPRATLKGHTDLATAVAVAPDGSRIASVSRDGTIRIWDPGQDSTLAVMRADDVLNGCAWAAHGQAIAAAGDKGTYYFRIRPSTANSLGSPDLESLAPGGTLTTAGAGRGCSGAGVSTAEMAGPVNLRSISE